MTEYYFKLDHHTTMELSKLKECTIKEFKTNLDFLRLNYVYRIESRTVLYE